ncbi:MAG: amino acid adenylation domain-containing protein [Limisphaerales bacterium]
MEYLLHHLLANSAQRDPAREAVRMDGKALTYGELDEISNRLAQTLRAAGVRRGDRVGIYVHKSIASVISVYAISKAGAAYVPLDPNAPVKRLAYITRDCTVNVLLTSPAKIAGLAEFAAENAPIRTVIVMESLGAERPEVPASCALIPWEQVTQAAPTPPWVPEAIETDLAYILYTSGSTGAPKGVMISHRTVFTFIDWAFETFRMTPEDRVTSQAPLHFDLSTFDLYATAKAGATLVLVGERLAALPVQLAALLQNERITITYLVPSILSFMVNYGKLDAHDTSRLRIVLFAGEVFPIKYLRRLVAAIPQAEYYNLYGPTETNVCTYYKVQPGDLAPDRETPLPIGVACENIEAFAVNDQGQLVTVPDQEGELWVRGSCVAQGYWGDPAKTAKAFVPNPYQTSFAETAYRTGDIVTLAPDLRNWLYVGRRDHMIKSRGYRIELGEIESAMYRHDQVKEAAVVAVPDELIGNRIRAYAVLSEPASLTAKELEAFCARHVPKYMVPESVTLLESLPKTSTGKIDRQALLKHSPTPVPMPAH